MDDLRKAIDAVAKQKRRQAEAMRQRVDPTLENSKDVVAAFSRELYERFAGDGFTYAASKRTMKRVVGDWTQEIILDGHGGNTPGREIVFHVWALVRNLPLKKWRKSVRSPFYRDDDGIVSSPARLIPGWPKKAWDLHERSVRPRTMDEAATLIRQKLLPMLDVFTDRDALRQRIMSEQQEFNDRLVMLDDSIDLLLYYFDGRAAAALVDDFAERHGDETYIADALARVRSGWRPRARLGNEHEMVALAVEIYNLPATHPMLAKSRRAEPPPSSAEAAESGAEIVRDALRDAGFVVEPSPTPRDPKLDAWSLKHAATMRREMNDTSLSRTKRNNAAHLACVALENVAPDEQLWEVLAERLKLGLLNKKSAMWPFTVELVKRLVARSTPPRGCEHVAAAYLGQG